MKKFKYNPYFPYFLRLKAHLVGKRHQFKDPILSNIEDYLQYVDSLNEELECYEHMGKMSRLFGKQVSIANYKVFVLTGLLPFYDPDILDAYFIHSVKSSGCTSSDSKYYPHFAEELVASLNHLKFFFEVLADSHEELVKTWHMRDEIVSDKVAKECKGVRLWLEEKIASLSSDKDAVKAWFDDMIAREGFEDYYEVLDYATDYSAIMPVAAMMA